MTQDSSFRPTPRPRLASTDCCWSGAPALSPVGCPAGWRSAQAPRRTPPGARSSGRLRERWAVPGGQPWARDPHAAAGPRAPSQTEAPQSGPHAPSSARPRRDDNPQPDPAVPRSPRRSPPRPPPARRAAYPPSPWCRAAPLSLQLSARLSAGFLRTRPRGPAPAEHAPPAAHPRRLGSRPQRALGMRADAPRRGGKPALAQDWPRHREAPATEWFPPAGADWGGGYGDLSKEGSGALGAGRAACRSRRSTRLRVGAGTRVCISTTSGPEQVEKGRRGYSGQDLSTRAMRLRPIETARRRRETGTQQSKNPNTGRDAAVTGTHAQSRDRVGIGDSRNGTQSLLGEESQRPLWVLAGAGDQCR